MGIIYNFKPNDNGLGIGNLDGDCIGCAQTCVAKSEIVKCQVTGKYRRRGITDVSLGKLYLCTDKAIKSSRIFREKTKAFSEMIPFFVQARVEANRLVSDDVRRLIHNLITLNAQTIQAIYRVVPQDDFNQESRESLINTVSRKLSDSTDLLAPLVINILKNANLEKTEFSVYTKLIGKEPIKCRYYSIHKIFRLVLNTYWDALRDKEVSVRVGDCRDEVFIDYDTIAASLVHLLDNTTKYILPKSRLNIYFETTLNSVSLVLDMVSLRIRTDEIDKIFDEGFSGEEPKKISRQGEGRGLYLVKRLLTLSDSVLKIEPDVDSSLRENRMGVDFENNVLRLSMPRG